MARKIETKKVDERARLPKQVREKLKDMGLSRRVSFMKEEVLSCPMFGEDISPAYCMACPYFARRVKGVVHCRYPEGDPPKEEPLEHMMDKERG